jgi:hypothetical protein
LSSKDLCNRNGACLYVTVKQIFSIPLCSGCSPGLPNHFFIHLLCGYPITPLSVGIFYILFLEFHLLSFTSPTYSLHFRLRHIWPTTLHVASIFCSFSLASSWLWKQKCMLTSPSRHRFHPFLFENHPHQLLPIDLSPKILLIMELWCNIQSMGHVPAP